MKRGQVEIMGLMIIVVILALALLFVVRVVFTAKPALYAESYETNKLVESFVNTLFQTTADCTGDVTIQELLIDCAKNTYSGGSLVCDLDTQQRRSCAFVNETVGVILENSLNQWGIEAQGYEFVAVAPPDEQIVYHVGGDLSQSLGGEVEPFTLRLYPSTQDLYVYLCIGGCGFT